MFRRAPKPLVQSDPFLEINGFTVHVKPHPTARRVTLRYDGKKEHFVVTTPQRTSKKFITAFLTTHQNWMAQQQSIAPQKINPLQQGRITIQGIERRIEHNEAAGVAVTLHPEHIEIRCRAERVPRALQRFVKQHAEQIITPLCHDKAAQIDKKISAVNFRDTTSRWGSCAHDGKLSFSWRLIFAPQEVIDYVVAHEVAHLQHFDHSPAFWTLCRKLSTDYTKGKHWLQLNGQSLQQIEL